MATKWESFYPHVQPYVPGCPEIVIETHLQEAAADFCAKSEVWRFNLDPDFTSKNTPDYEIDVPTGAALENILFLYLDGYPLTHVSERHYSAPLQPDGSSTKGTPGYFSILADESVRMYPTPEGKHVFTGIGVLKPKLSATGVEDFIFETYGRVIASGAIARLAEIPNKEWSNPDLAMRSRIDFDREICRAKGRDTRRVNLRVAPIGFA
jgi:hypothetical protein